MVRVCADSVTGCGKSTHCAELFFDIIFAFALGAVRQEISTTLLACDPLLQGMSCRLLTCFCLSAIALRSADCSFGMGMLSSFTLFFTFFWNAYLMVIFTNRFTTGKFPGLPNSISLVLACKEMSALSEEFGFNLWMYASMACTAIMAVSALDCFGKNTHCASILSTSNASDGHASFPVFAAAAAVASALTGLQFTRTLYMARARKYSALYATGCFITAAVWVCAAIWAKSASAHVGLATAVCVFQLCVDVFSRVPGIQLHTRLPDHAAARFRKFGVVMLTQLLMGVLAPGATYTQRSYVFAGGVLFLSVLHKMVHYDFNQGQRADGFALNPRVTEFVYVVCNLVLAYSFTALGAVTHSVLTSIGDDTDDSSADERVRWFFCAAMGTAILCSTLIQAVLLGKGHAVRRCGKKLRTLFRILLVLITVLLPAMLPHDFPSEKLVWILAAIVGIELVGDIVGRQQIRAAPGENGSFAKLDVYSEAIGLGEASKKKRQSRAAAHFQSALWRTVREGKGGSAAGKKPQPPPAPSTPAAPPHTAVSSSQSSEEPVAASADVSPPLAPPRQAQPDSEPAHNIELGRP